MVRPMRERYEPFHPDLFGLPDDCLDAAFLAAISDGRPEALDALVDRPHPGIVTFPLFSSRFCQALVAEARRFEGWCAVRGIEPSRPNSMNAYGAVLAEMGLESLAERLLEWLAPLAARYFAPHGGDTLDAQHTFLVEYARDGDLDLGFHVDDSEVTLNACLGDVFDGGEVYFEGVRCAEHRQTRTRASESYELVHRVGHAALHAGAHRHGVRMLIEGRRTNLIAWFRSSGVRLDREGCEPWCALHPG